MNKQQPLPPFSVRQTTQEELEDKKWEFVRPEVQESKPEPILRDLILQVVREEVRAILRGI